MSRWALAFFGLTSSSRADYILESFFLLTYYCGFTYQDVRSMPVAERNWFVDRLVKEFERQNKQAKENDTVPLSKAAHANDPATRTIMGMSRSNPPTRSRRFT